MKNRTKGWHKYGAKKWACKQLGDKCKSKHDSKAEAARCNQLYISEQAGKLKYQTQITYPFVINGYLICKHVVDFRIYYKDEIWVEDVKSEATATPEWKIKYKLFNTLYPSVKYVINWDGVFNSGKAPVIKAYSFPKSEQQELVI